MTFYHKFDDPPVPSDFELEALDRRRRLEWLREAEIAAEDARDEKCTQADALGILF